MPAARPGATVASKLRALAGLAAAQAAGAWRIGVSVSSSGAYLPDFFRGKLGASPCAYCHNVETALELWAGKARDSGLLNVTFDIRDDGAQYPLMLQNYQDLVQDPSIHILLGPSYGIWNDAAGAIADNGSKVMIKWAFDVPSIYNNLPWSAKMYSNASFLEEMISEELRLEEAALGSSSASSALTPSSSSSTAGASPSGSVVTRFSFDVNIRPSHWAEDAIDSIGLDGHQFLFVWYEDLPGRYRHESLCMDYTRHVQQRGGSASVMPLHWYAGSFVELGTLATIQPDVVCVCGPDYAIVSLMIYLEAKRVVPRYMLAGQPVGQSEVLSKDGALMSYVLEPVPIAAPDMQRPDPVFGNTLSFLSAWFSRVGSYPGYEAFQVAGSLSLLAEALRAQDPGTFSSEALAQTLRSSRVGTVLGWLSFTEEGERAPGADRMPSTRQLLPEPVRDFVSNLLRYQRGHAQVVSPSAKDSCRGERCKEAIAARVAVTPDTWQSKQIEAYPCPAGCVLTAERCVPCPRGTRRNPMEIECRACDPGEFTEYPGMRECRPCPRGGVCRTPDHPFVNDIGYCRVLPWFGDCRSHFPNHTFRTDLAQMSGDDLECTEKQLPPADTTFKRCIPTRVCMGGAQPCVGSNRGMLCGQCPVHQTYFGVGSGRRLCRECPPMAELVFGHVIVGLSLILIVTVMQRVARKTATRPNYLTAPLFRSLVHYMHLVSAVCENTHLDANPVVAWLLLPLDILYRPLDLASTHCFHDIPEEDRGDEAKLWMRPEITFSLSMVPLGIIFILAIHLGELLLRWLWRCVFCWIGRQIWDRCFKAEDEDTPDAGKPASEAEGAGAKKAEETGTAKAVQGLSPDKAQSVDEEEDNVSLQRSSKSFAFSDISDNEGLLQRGRSASVMWPSSPSNTAAESPTENSPAAGGGAQGSMEPMMLPSQAVTAGTPQETTPTREQAVSENTSPSRGRLPSDGESVATKKSARFADEDGSPLASTRPIAPQAEPITTSRSFFDVDFGAVVSAASEASLNKDWQTVASPSRSGSSITDVREFEEEEEVFERKEEFKSTDPASIIYSLQNSMWYFSQRIRDVKREVTMWVLLMYPQGIRSLMRIGTCFPIVEGEPWRLGMDFDVECTKEHQDNFKTLATALTFGIPAVVFLYLYRHSGDLFDLHARRAISIFTAGYKPDAYMWEFLTMMRTGLVIRMSSEPSFIMRCLAMFVIIGSFLFLNLVLQPFEAHGRFAMQKFDRSSQFGIVLLIILGVMNQEEVDETVGNTLSAVVNPAGFWSVMFAFFVLAWNLYAVFRALWGGAFLPMLHELQAIIDDGGAVSNSLRMVLRFVNATHGIHQVLYYKDKQTGEYIMDASELNRRERDFLLFSLQEIISACVDSESDLHTALIEKAIMEAFQRARRAKEGLKNNLYYHVGLRTQQRGCLPCFEAALRNPDIPADSDFKEDHEVIKVTVEELHTALRDVSLQVLDHQGSLRKDMQKAESEKAELESRERADSHHVLMWNQNESVKKLDEELDFKSSALSLSRAGTADMVGKTMTTSTQQSQQSQDTLSTSVCIPDEDTQPNLLATMEDDFKRQREKERASGRLAVETTAELRKQLEGLQAEADALLAHLQSEWTAVEERHYREQEQKESGRMQFSELEMPEDLGVNIQELSAQQSGAEEPSAQQSGAEEPSAQPPGAQEPSAQPPGAEEPPAGAEAPEAAGGSSKGPEDGAEAAEREATSQPDVVESSGNAQQDQRRQAARPKQKANRKAAEEDKAPADERARNSEPAPEVGGAGSREKEQEQPGSSSTAV